MDCLPSHKGHSLLLTCMPQAMLLMKHDNESKIIRMVYSSSGPGAGFGFGAGLGLKGTFECKSPVLLNSPTVSFTSAQGHCPERGTDITFAFSGKTVCSISEKDVTEVFRFFAMSFTCFCCIPQVFSTKQGRICPPPIGPCGPVSSPGSILVPPNFGCRGGLPSLLCETLKDESETTVV